MPSKTLRDSIRCSIMSTSGINDARKEQTKMVMDMPSIVKERRYLNDRHI